MSAFVVASVLALTVGGVGAQKRAVLSVTGTASYDTGGSALDLSSANTTLTGLNAMAAFTRVDGINVVGVNPHASGKYHAAHVRASSGAPATGKLKLYDVTTDPGAEVSSTTDLSSTTFFLEVFGT
jgi:hypothetical protein